jgi:hypothetical protein
MGLRPIHPQHPQHPKFLMTMKVNPKEVVVEVIAITGMVAMLLVMQRLKLAQVITTLLAVGG